ncbi:two-component system sensor histidine kinase DcuS [Metabacillus litoralis]|uniref:histidine kinase n=1 Tax=Metabacillus litoralis TaxID=152268 RepID=A0A5C6W906_9BACI|nr:DcuS/MalK family sensor histidine kinase [Metabacillus litoralis]TXC92930.1 two-component system sensor histidine kinase DcuS [Metabacillus litoralis]
MNEVIFLLKRPFSLSFIITIFGCVVVLLSLLITDLLINFTTSERIIDNQEEKAQIVSRTVAESKIVKDHLLLKGNTEEVQDYTLEVQEITDMMFVVVMNMEGVRQSHPNPNLIGKKFVGGDEKEVLQGREYISKSKGTLGDSLRAFTPVYDTNDNQIGAVAVGISLEDVQLSLTQNHRNIIIGSVFGILVGILGAFLLAKYIKRMLFGLEPYAISKLLQERSTMLQSVHEGVLAVDENLTITLVNKSALALFEKAGLEKNPVGMKISDYMSNSTIERVIKTGESERDVEQLIKGMSILANREPLIVNNKIVGAISTFRDKTEVNQLANQLTGIQTYVETLRAQSHEFMNRLHVIFGMVQLEAYDELKSFIRQIIDHQNQEVAMVTNSIKDPVLAGFILGKLSYAREEKVELKVINDTEFSRPLSIESSQELITIIGNLIDNAIEALSTSKEKKIELKLKEEGDMLHIEVSDTGPGITETNQDSIFKKGFSTKGTNRGIGLYLTKQSIEKLNGKLNVITSEKGTTFKVAVEYVSRKDVKKHD